MLLFRRESLLGASRAFWVWGLAALCVIVALLPLLVAWFMNQGERYEWLRGSSAFGIFCGIVGGWLIVFEMLYWVRRKWRGYPSNHYVRKEITGYPVGSAPFWPTFGRAFVQLLLSPVYIGWGMFCAVVATALNTPGIRPRHQRQPDGHIPRGRFCGLRERMTANVQYCWLRIKDGLWLVIGPLLFFFQILPLGIVWIMWRVMAPRWVKPVVLSRFGGDVRKMSEKQYKDYRAALSLAVTKERDRVTRYIFPTQIWLIGHIIFGLVSFIAIAYHTGYRSGGTLSTLLSIAFYLVILSGVWGLWMQQFRPRQIRDEIEEETVASQIDFVMGQRMPEAERVFQELTGLNWQHEYWASSPLEVRHRSHGGHGHEHQVQEQPYDAPVRERPARELHNFFLGQVMPYMLSGRASRAELTSGDKSTRLFSRLRSLLPANAHSGVGKLEEICDYRRILDRQASLNWWLHSWLYFHLSLSVLMFLMMIVHVFVAFKFW